MDKFYRCINDHEIKFKSICLFYTVKSFLFRLMHHAPYLKDYEGSHNSYLIQNICSWVNKRNIIKFLKDITLQIRDNARI